MENFNPEDLAEKVKLALELKKKEAEKKNKKEQPKKDTATGTLRTKARAPPRGRISKRGAKTSATKQHAPKRSLVDEDELRGSPSGKIILSGSIGMPRIEVEITG